MTSTDIYNECPMNFRQFLEIKFLDWQRESGGRSTVDEFAKYLGVGRTALSNWWSSDRTPQGENVHKLAMKLGLDVYDALGLPRPDLDLYLIQKYWDVLPPDVRRRLREQAEQSVLQNETKRPSQKRRTRTSE